MKRLLPGFSTVLLTVCIWLGDVEAHEVRPAYLEIREIASRRCDVIWKVPLRGVLRLNIEPLFPEDWEETADRSIEVLPGAVVERWQVNTGEHGLDNALIKIERLPMTMVDVLLRIERLGGRSYTSLLRRSKPSYTVPTTDIGAEGVQTYLGLGVKHILLGVDHLLFVFCLILLVSGPWLLLKTITSFTVAHSITLALATLGVVNVPSAPVEAIIALSIVFLSAELVRARRGEYYLTVRHPWIVASGFGLLHGLGFAGALTELGLPASAIPIALLLFNVGVEIGQLLFIVLVLAMFAAHRRLDIKCTDRWRLPVLDYAIGSYASFWFIGRIASMF